MSLRSFLIVLFAALVGVAWVLMLRVLVPETLIRLPLILFGGFALALAAGRAIRGDG